MKDDAEMLIRGEPIALRLLYLLIVLALGAIAGLALAALLSTGWVDAMLLPVDG